MKVVNGYLVSVARVNGKDVSTAVTERWSGGKKAKFKADLLGAAQAILRRYYPGYHSETSGEKWWLSFRLIGSYRSRLFARGDDWEVKFNSSGKDVEEEDKAKGWYFTGGRSEAFK